jgi:hypothetical protein
MTILAEQAIDIWHVVKGEPAKGDAQSYSSGGFTFRTPALDLPGLTWSRSEPCPAAKVPIAEIIDLLDQTGRAMAADVGGYISEAVSHLAETGSYRRDALDRMFADMPHMFAKRYLEAVLEGELGGPDVLDAWRTVGIPGEMTARVHAYPPRTVHILAGNAPVVAALTITRAAMTKGVSLLKLASNDLFTVPAVLRTMAHVAPGHPVVRSFSAVYWRGGDERMESALFRSQFFDKLIAWGGDAAIRGSIKYVAPGFELISYDPKNSISMVGREAHSSAETVQAAASGTAAMATMFNQEACSASRFVYVEGSAAEVDRFCEVFVGELGKPRPEVYADSKGPPVPADLREEINVLKQLAPEYAVWGSFDGSGLVIRSQDPVDFYPSSRVVNVVRVENLTDALRWINVSTQTVGVYPQARIAELCDDLANVGAQLIMPIGSALAGAPGGPHDGMYPMTRMMRWVERRD